MAPRYEFKIPYSKEREKEITKWCRDNIYRYPFIDPGWYYGYYSGSLVFCIKDKEKAFEFALRFL